jgi:quinol monooxygenase YgiN
VAELVVVSLLRAKPGRREEVVEALRDDLKTAHREAGVLRFAVHGVIDDPDRLVVVEVFRNAADLDAHYETEAFKHIVEILPDLIVGDVEVVRTVPVPIGDPHKGVLD